MLGKKLEELLHLRGTEIAPIAAKLKAFTEKVQEDINKKRISESDGQRLILKATMVVNMLTTT